MRIKRLKIKNLNSLYGEWTIDFTHKSYTEESLFAIVGPTGSGKSTILDAICLALYGQTPRLERISTADNQILSRQRGECEASLLFETQEGEFLATWSQRRAYGKADGKLAEAKHELSSPSSGKVLSTKKTETRYRIEATLGMNIDQFYRSSLLAQGHFDKFLKAKVDDRASLLEKITGTDIYSQISTKVYFLYKEAQEALKLLQAQSEGSLPLSNEEENALTLKQGSEALKAEELKEQLRGLDADINRIRQLKECEESINSLEQNKLLIQNEQKAFAPERQALEKALLAREFEGDYTLLESLLQNIKDIEESLQTQKNQYPQVLESFKKSDQLCSHYEENLESLGKKRAQSTPLWRDVILLDTQIQGERDELSQQKDHLQEKTASFDTIKQQIKECDTQIKELEIQQETSGLYLRDHAFDQSLSGSLGEIELLSKGILSAQSDVRTEEERSLKISGDILKQKTDLSHLQEIVQKHEANIKGEQKLLEDLEEQKQKILEGASFELLRERLGHLREKKSLQDRIESLEVQRKNLKKGSPCPLCGAMDHPYLEGKPEKQNDIEKQIDDLDLKIQTLEQVNQDINHHTQEISLSQKGLSDIKERISLAEDKLEQLEGDLEDQNSRLDQKEATLQEQEQAFIGILKPYGETYSRGDFSMLLALKTRAKIYGDNQRLYDSFDEHKSILSANLESLKGQKEHFDKLVGELNNKFKATESALDQKVKTRFELFENKDPQKEETQLNEQEGQIKESLRVERLKREECLNQKSHFETSIAKEEHRLNELKVSSQRGLDDFIAQLNEGHFSSVELWQKARLDKVKLRLLEERALALDEREKETQIKMKEGQERLVTLQGEGEELFSSDDVLDSLQKERSLVDTPYQETLKALGGLQEQIDDNERRKASRQVSLEKIEVQRAQVSRFEGLQTLIGSADGKKYKRFVQGLTFEQVVHHANQHLQKMSDRYLLVLDKSAPLELNVVDLYQGGEERSVKNLSGGESFILSLALALGLSTMTSQNIRVDSLFLDEGFGTLDEEALEQALSALSSLREEGKTIGLISHVEALKERVFTKLSLEPQSGGSSTLSGPGVQRGAL